MYLIATAIDKRSNSINELVGLLETGVSRDKINTCIGLVLLLLKLLYRNIISLNFQSNLKYAKVIRKSNTNSVKE